jgi:hypothetical protein
MEKNLDFQGFSGNFKGFKGFLAILVGLGVVQASLDFSSTTYPFPADDVTDLNESPEQEKYDCAYDLVNDGKCDGFNNKVECGFDGGDCCRESCERYCKEEKCYFECGSAGYDCLVDTTCWNCTHGTCNSMSKCFLSDEQVKLGVLNCQRNNIAHGNSSTADFYCGKDPNKTISHSFDQYGFHFPGCGLAEDLCSSYQCCSDLEANNLTSETCTTEKQTLLSFNYETKNLEEVETSCIELFRECFVNNSRVNKGECCECDEGWVGRNCDIPSCFPDCKHGKCVDIDLCECDDGWSDVDCSVATCKDCKNGKCIAPDVCFCTYGWNGTACDVPYATPACVYGIAIAPDVCKCEDKYTGDRCEIPKCESCNKGWCVNPGVCECYPPYYSKSPSLWCTDLICSEIFGSSCLNCSNSSCTRCKVGYFLNDSFCTECESFNVHCLECNKSQCTQCAWPYSAEGYDCIFSGFLEFSSKFFTFLKSSETAELKVFRIGPVTSRVEVSFKLVGISGRIRKDADFGYSEGSLFFDPGVSEQVIRIPIYNKFYDSVGSVNFYVLLFNPVGGVFFGLNLTRIADFTWSDKGISVISYCVVEIWDNPTQALPELTSYVQEHPETSFGSFNFTFNAFNSEGKTTNTAIFVVQVRKILSFSINTHSCLFDSNSFDEKSSIFTIKKVTGSSTGYYSEYLLTKGLYTLTPYTALPGVYCKIYSNLLLQGVAIEEGIRRSPGWYNNYTMPRGNSSSTWEFIYFPSSSFEGSLSVTCSSSDLINVTINENLILDCIGSCSSSVQTITQGIGLLFFIKYFHFQDNPGFFLVFQSSATYSLTEIFAVNKTSVLSRLFVVEKDEC